jgi:hypothetical protein
MLTHTIANLGDKPPHGMTKIPAKEEVLNMCASGKDRTGLAEHDQTAQALAAELGIPVKDIDRKLLLSGHTAQQAGGMSSGGGTLGCYGTKKENEAGLPESRRKELEGIIEVSASTNKIKKPGKIKKIKKKITKDFRRLFSRQHKVTGPHKNPSPDVTIGKKGGKSKKPKTHAQR